jgi:hypothetical protein
MLRAVRRLPRVWRIALPFIAGCLCLVAADWVSPFPAYVLIMAGIGLVADAGLALMPTAGGLWAHRQ